MSSKIHHNTVKKARKFGVELAVVENEFEARKDGQMLAMHASASVALDRALEKLNGAADPLERVKKATAAIRKMTRAKPAKKARKARKTRKTRNEDLWPDELPEDNDDGSSIIKRKYKTRYKPFKMTCGDDLAQQLAEHLKVKDDGGDKPRVDETKLKRFAQANGCWDPKYGDLNVGMRRMNVVNRLRGKIRRDKHEVVWAS